MSLILDARRSVYDTLAELFTEGTLLGTSYHVYNEEDLRQGTAPVRPFVYILDYGAAFELRHLPAIVVQLGVRKRPLGLGQLAYYCHLVLHVFGRNRGERDSITSAIMDAVDHIDIRDYNHDARPIAETVQLESLNREGDIWIEEVVELPGRLINEGTAANWATLLSSFWVV